jgi:hypothetical protein
MLSQQYRPREVMPARCGEGEQHNRLSLTSLCQAASHISASWRCPTALKIAMAMAMASSNLEIIRTTTQPWIAPHLLTAINGDHFSSDELT